MKGKQMEKNKLDGSDFIYNVEGTDEYIVKCEVFSLGPMNLDEAKEIEKELKEIWNDAGMRSWYAFYKISQIYFRLSRLGKTTDEFCPICKESKLVITEKDEFYICNCGYVEPNWSESDAWAWIDLDWGYVKSWEKCVRNIKALGYTQEEVDRLLTTFFTTRQVDDPRVLSCIRECHLVVDYKYFNND